MTEKKGDEAAPEAADVPPTRKHEALATTRMTQSPATYVKGYEHHDGLLQILAESLVFSTKKDRKGAVALYGMLGFLFPKYEPLVTVPLADIRSVTTTDDGIEVETARDRVKFKVEQRDAWAATLREPVEPPARTSHLSLDNIPVGYPDDGPLASLLRTVDHGVGVIELALLIAVFGAVVIVASLSAISDHFFHHQIGQWWNFLVRKGTFAIAMFGAAYATQQQRLLAMDLVSRRLSPRGRLVLGLVLKVFTVVVAGVLVYIGMYMHEHAVNGGAKLDLTLFKITEKDAMFVIPAGAALILFHSLLHAVIDGEYLVRNRLPPERARSGH